MRLRVLSLVASLNQIAHIGAQARHTQQPTLFVEQGRYLLGAIAFGIHQIGHCPGINIARAGSHHQSLQWSQSHRGIHALAIFYGCYGGTIAEVAGYHLTAGFAAKHLSHTLCDKTVTGSMESITAHSVVLIEVVWQRIHECLSGHRLMECGIKHGHLWHLWQQFRNGLYAGQVRRVVQRGKFLALLYLLYHSRIYQHTAVEFLTSMHHAVSHCVYLVQR